MDCYCTDHNQNQNEFVYAAKISTKNYYSQLSVLKCIVLLITFQQKKFHQFAFLFPSVLFFDYYTMIIIPTTLVGKWFETFKDLKHL